MARLQTTYLTFYMPTRGIENATPQEIKELLIKNKLIYFDDDKFLSAGFGGGINVEIKKSIDISNHEMWEATIIVGDEDGTYVKRQDSINRQYNLIVMG